MDSTTPTQNRRVMSMSSALGPVSAVTRTGSSAIPQMGHDPGPGCRISGCIGHVYSATSPSGAEDSAAAGIALASAYWSGLASNFAWQCASRSGTSPRRAPLSACSRGPRPSRTPGP